MTTEVLGKYSFSQVPDVAGSDLMLNTGGVPSMSSGTTAARPAAGTAGTLYVDTTANILYRDNGSAWVAIGAGSTLTGTASEIAVVGNVISIASDPILPGTGSFQPPLGTTAQRPATPATGVARFNTTLGYTEEFNGTSWRPIGGQLIQHVDGAIPASTGATAIPLDNTVPLSTEGTQIWTQSFTPTSTTSHLVITFSLTHSNSNTSTTNILTVFAGTTCIGAQASRIVANNAAGMMSMRIVYFPASTAPVTISARFGGSTTTTWYVNQTNTATLGGALASEFTIQELE
jgi:hypothetical protein